MRSCSSPPGPLLSLILVLPRSFYEGNLTPIQLLVDLVRRQLVSPFSLPLILALVTQKTRGNETYHAVVQELAPLRERGWLTRWNGTHVVPGASLSL